MADVVVKLRDVEDAIFAGLNSSRELRRAFNDFIDDVHDTWKRFSPKPTGVPRKKDVTVAERWATYLEVGGNPGHPYSTGAYLASVKKKKLPLRQRLFIKRTLRQGVPIGNVYSDSDIAHLVEYGSESDGPGSQSPWGPNTPTPEFAPMRKTVALMNGGEAVHMTDLYPWVTPDGVELLIVWLAPLGEVRDERPPGAVLPYWMVHGLDGPSDGLTEEGVYSVHSFAKTKAKAHDAAIQADRRIKLLGGRFVEPQRVTISTGVVQADRIRVLEKPHWERWVEDNSIHRFVATYQIDLRLVAAT